LKSSIFKHITEAFKSHRAINTWKFNHGADY